MVADMTILISRGQGAVRGGGAFDRAGGQAVPAGDARNWPHPDNLKWHRVTVFGQMDLDQPAPWG